MYKYILDLAVEKLAHIHPSFSTFSPCPKAAQIPVENIARTNHNLLTIQTISRPEALIQNPKCQLTMEGQNRGHCDRSVGQSISP